MKVNRKIIGCVGAIMVTMSATGAVVFADTTSATASTGRSAYAAQIKTEMQQIQSFQGQRKQLNQQIMVDFKALKGHQLKKNDPTDYQAIEATHQQILGARAKLYTDDAAVLLDRQSKNWAKVTTDLQTKGTDLQSLLSLKQQQLQNLQSALARVGSSSNPSSTQTNA